MEKSDATSLLSTQSNGIASDDLPVGTMLRHGARRTAHGTPRPGDPSNFV